MARKPRRFGNKEEKPVFYVAFEDSKSAVLYLQAVFKSYPQVRLVVVKEGQAGTAPDQVVKCVAGEAANKGDRDRLWAIFDAEPQAGGPQRERIQSAKRIAEHNGISLAISNPCFEHWLRLHIEDGDGSFYESQRAVDKFSACWKDAGLGKYNKGTARFERLATQQCVETAAMRSKKQHAAKGGKSPEECQPCVTDMYRLIDELLEMVSTVNSDA